ncbi:MAG: coproporphyrinogen III oxidase, partial [Micavibrio aeruginosavorus]
MEDFMKDRILTFDAAAPRYTSYPPATAFHAGFTAEDYECWLSAIPADEPVSLYVHIPFCRQLCYYCGCHTTIARKDERIFAYINDLLKELSLVAGKMSGTMNLRHLHFGGGSPTILKPSVFAKVMQAVRENFNILPIAEIAIEADPRQMDEARISCFARCGINRISLGVQDIDQKVMGAVNRAQPFHLSWKAAELCRLYGIRNINLDLMYGLPGQTVQSIRHTVETVLTLKPSRIAFFGYAHVPWMKKHMDMLGGLDLPDSSLRYDLYEAGSSILKDEGYLPVGIDHFVRPSDNMAKALGNRTL